MNPTSEQVEYLKRACGTRRFIYNWGREQWEKQYQAYKLEQETVPEAERLLRAPNANALKAQFHAIREQEYPWTYDVTKCVVEGAFSDLGQAYANFFAGRGNYPNYKKKGQSHESFYLSNDKFTVGSHWIAIPGLGRFILDGRKQEKDRGKLRRKLGTVNLAEKLRFVEVGHATVPSKKRNRRKQVVCEGVKILGATVSCEAGHWSVSIQVEIQHSSGCPPQVHHRTGTDLRGDRHRRPQHPGDDGQSESGARYSRCRDGAIVAVPQEQSGKCRGKPLHCLALVSLDQTLFVLRACQETHAPQTPHLSVPCLRAGDRPGFERRFKLGMGCQRNASPTSCLKLAVLGSGYDRDVKCLWSRCETVTRGLIQRFSCDGCRLGSRND